MNISPKTAEPHAELDKSYSNQKDYQFVEWLTRVKKLTAIPPSAFYSDANKYLGEEYIRFCFIKVSALIDIRHSRNGFTVCDFIQEDANLQKAEAILQEWKKTIN